MLKLLMLAGAGSLGCLARYGLTGLVQRLAGSAFPYGTLVVNVLGCLLFGLVWGILEKRVGLGVHWRLLVLTGFLGSFTTFSTFTFESMKLLENGAWALAFANVTGQVLAGLVMVYLGLQLGKSM